MAVDNVKGKGVVQRNDTKPIVDAYRAREEEMKKHYEKQLRSIQDTNSKNISKMRTESEAAMAKFNEEAQERMNHQDLKNTEQVKEMNRLHRNTLRKNAEETEKKFQMQKALNTEAVENLESRKNEQIGSIQEGYTDYIDKQRKEFSHAIEQNREDTVNSITSERRQLIDKSEKERRRLEKQRFEDIADVQNEKDIMRRQKDSQLRLAKDQQWLSKEDLSDKYKASLQTLNETYANRLTMQKTGFDEGLAEIRGKAHKTNEAQKDLFDENLSKLRQKANERTVDQVNKLERQLTAAKQHHTDDDVKLKNQFRKEKKEYFDQLRHRQKVMEEQRIASLNDSNEQHAVVIEKLNKQSSNQAEKQATLYREKSLVNEVINESKREDAVGQVKDQLLWANTKHKTDFQRERTARIIDKKDLEDHYQSIMERMRKSHAEHVLDLKAQNMRTQNEAIGNLNRSLKESENKNESRIQEQAAMYESKLQISDTDKRNGIGRERELATQRAKATERYHLLQMKTQEIQNQNQIAQLKEKYENQLDQLRRRIEKMHYDTIRTKT
jgi:hypothetical protein